MEVCRQSRLRGRIHARLSAGGLAALCVSRFFLFHLAFFLFLPPVLPPALPAGPGPGTPSGSTSTRSPPTRSSRTSPHSPSPLPYYLQFARYRMQVQASSVHPCFYTSNREPADYDDLELTCFAFERMFANERDIVLINSSINILKKCTYDNFCLKRFTN